MLLTKLRFTILLILTVTIFNLPSFSVNYTLSGNVLDSISEKPMEYVTVQLFNYLDTTLFYGTITNEKGFFKIDKIEDGNYYAKLNYLGYETYIIDSIKINKNIVFKNIFLKPNNNLLTEIVVSENTKTIEYQINKQIINVTNDILDKSETVADILANSPSIKKLSNEEVLLRGSSNFKVLLNGKPTVSNDILEQVPVNLIEKIEIITNPSANFDAEGNVGIINIITKKAKFEGIGLNVKTSTTNNNKYSVKTNLSITKNKLQTVLNFSYNNSRSYALKERNVDYLKNEDYNFYKADLNKKYNNKYCSLESTYSLNDNNIISISGSYNYYFSNFNAISSNKEKDTIINFSESVNDNYIYKNNSTFLLDYTHYFKSTSYFNTSFFYNLNNDTVNANLHSINLLPNGEYTNFYNYKYTDNKILNSSYLVYSFDYHYILNEKYKIETGIKYSKNLNNANYNLSSYDSILNQWNINNYFSSKPSYDRNIYASYFILEGKLFGIDFNLGLRNEFNNQIFQFKDKIEKYNYNKLNWFPSVSFSKLITSKQTLALSYSKRISRPAFESLNSSPVFTDANDYFVGSPILLPQLSHKIETSYNLSTDKIIFNTNIFYSNTLNYITDYINYNYITEQSIKNGISNSSLGSEINFDTKIFKWYKITPALNFNFENYKYYDNNLIIKSNNFNWSLSLNNYLKFKTNTAVWFDLYYFSAQANSYIKTNKYYYLEVGVSQRLWKNKIRLSISIDNIFNDSFSYSQTNELYSIDYKFYDEYPMIYFTFSIKLNNFKAIQLKSFYEDDYSGGNLR